MAENTSDSTRYFKQADELYCTGRYQEAMQVLSELNRRYPNTKNILYPLALCLEKLQRTDEAVLICDQLTALFQDPRAAQLKERISAAQMSALFAPIDLDMPRRTEAPHPPLDNTPQTDNRRWIYTAVAAILIILLPLVLFPLLRSPGTNGAPAAPAVQSGQPVAEGQIIPAPAAGMVENREQPRAPLISPLASLLLNFLITYSLSIAVTYPILMVMQRLREDTFKGNVIDIARTLGICSLWALLPIIGVFIGAVYFMRHYELSCLEMIVLGLITGVLWMFLMFFLMSVLMGGAVLVGA